MYTKHEMEKAIQLREEGHLIESNELLIQLAKEHHGDPVINYQCAWSYDVLGEEREAVPYYEKAISLGLEGEDLEGALLKLGSTYRTLGEYEKSRRTFLKGIELFPHNHAIRVFYAMTLFNLKDHNQAMEILLKSIAETSNDPQLVSYKRAIEFYSDKLDQVWD
ncbi:tetratricopeptide repeat protein [Heyndrickxia sporothermodurans]|uniref:tetratricopeptide repeat protein n=1 Tax=Heyndrickxia sporothermodurans TaxID=46224 RepID=UPI0035DF331E